MSKHKSRGKTRKLQLERRKQAAHGVKSLLGRDPSMGRVCFQTGTHLSKKNGLNSRSSKIARKELRLACES